MNHDDIVDVLNQLIENCRDGQYGFESCAEHVEEPSVRNVFLARASECQSAALELQALVLQYGGKPDDGGSMSGAVHRGWVAVKGTLAGYSTHAVLEECERGEDVAKARYRKALEQGLPEPVRAVVERQYQGVLRNHDQVRNLRDAYRHAA